MPHERVGFVAHHDSPGFGDGLQTRREIHLRPDDRVVDSISAPEISDIAKAGVHAHSDPKRVFDPFVAPFCVEFRDIALHVERHPQAINGIFPLALGLWVSKENQYCVTCESGDRAAMAERRSGHPGEVFIEKTLNLLRLQLFGGSREVYDIGKEDRQFLAFSLNSNVLPATED